MELIPSHIKQAIRDLAREGLPVDQIAFMTRVGRVIVEEILAAATETAPVVRAKAKEQPKPLRDRDS